MKLITKELEARFKELGTQDDVRDPIVVAKLFNPCGAGTWFLMSYDPETQTAFCYASIFGDHCDELGDVSIWELQEYKGPLGLGIERDLSWTEKPLSQAKAEYYASIGGQR